RTRVVRVLEWCADADLRPVAENARGARTTRFYGVCGVQCRPRNRAACPQGHRGISSRAQGRSRRGITGADDLFTSVELCGCVGEAACARGLGPRRGRCVIRESHHGDLEAAAGVVLELRAREADRRSTGDDGIRAGAIATVAEDAVPAADPLGLDALERDGE